MKQAFYEACRDITDSQYLAFDKQNECPYHFHGQVAFLIINKGRYSVTVNGKTEELSEGEIAFADSFDDYSFGGTALVGDPTDPDVLKQGGVENCDAVAAVSEDDSVNLMAAQIAKSIFRREKVICRVSDPHLQVLYHKTYELETVCPTVLTEQAVFRSLAK